MIVVDASAVLEVLLNTPAAGRIAERLFAPRETLHAPHVLDLEVAQVLRRYAASGQLDAQGGGKALEDFPARSVSEDTDWFAGEGRAGADGRGGDG